MVVVLLFGELEFWFVLIKVVVIIVFIFVGVYMIFIYYMIDIGIVSIMNLWFYGGFFLIGVKGFILVF